MPARGTRGAYRKEDRVQLPANLQKELVEKAAARYGNCQELAKHLNIPKSSVHYYRIGRLTMPVSVLEEMLKIADDDVLREKIGSRGITKDRSWATEYAQDIFREMCRERVRLPTRDELENDDDLRRKAGAIISYVMAEGSVWLQKERLGEHAANITFAEHETDLYEHFRTLCRDVFEYDVGPPQYPGNGARAIRGFIYSRFVAEWLVYNGVPIGDKAANSSHLPDWVMNSEDARTWGCAVQPWCDGEGSANVSKTSVSFSISQSRHSDIDVGLVDKRLACPVGKSISRGNLKKIEVHGVGLVDYCESVHRSTVFDDVHSLFLKLGFKPRLRLAQLRFKDDGFWSCVWVMSFRTCDSKKLLELNLITQEKKRRALKGE
jgi:hypothetical protein